MCIFLIKDEKSSYVISSFVDIQCQFLTHVLYFIGNQSLNLIIKKYIHRRLDVGNATFFIYCDMLK